MASHNILVPFDFSEFSVRALSVACDLAKSLNSEVYLVHVREGQQDPDTHRSTLEQLLAVVLPTQELQNVVHREVIYGVTHEELLKYAQKIHANMIVMGTRGRSGIVQLAMGSVVQRMLRTAHCPVVVVNSENAAEIVFDEADEKYESIKSNETPAVDLIARALSLRATDIHVDPSDDRQYSVRLRIDGKITPYCMLDDGVASHLINQYLTMARIDMADPFRAREGRLQLPAHMQHIEVRVTTSPVAGGDALALRLFAKDNVFLSLDKLGFSGQSLVSVQRMLHGNEGLVLITGPTGSGKTTTVYSMLESFGGQHHNIVSIEDPVEFSVGFVRQLSVDERHGVTMSSGLRTLLRMDPDIIFIGEIRDPEAAGIALRAANSGRFVFSSLHTRDVAATITALRDLEVTDHSLAGNLVGIVNQRLVRRLCSNCKKTRPIDAHCRETFAAEGIEPPTDVSDAVGCPKCRESGYYGRCGVFETIVSSNELAQAIAAGAPEAELRRIIRALGNASLTADALCKVRDHITSFEEAMSARWL